MSERYKLTITAPMVRKFFFTRKNIPQRKSLSELNNVTSAVPKLKNYFQLKTSVYVLHIINKVGDLENFWKNTTRDKLNTLEIKKNVEKTARIFKDIKRGLVQIGNFAPRIMVL